MGGLQGYTISLVRIIAADKRAYVVYLAQPWYCAEQ